VDNPFTNIHTVLFDLDGTLIRTHIDFPLMKRETLALAARYGLYDAAWEGLDVLSIVEDARRQLPDPAAGSRFRAEAFALLEEIETAHCAAPEEIPGAAKLLRTLRARGVRVGIVTRNCRRVSEQLLLAGGLEAHALLTRDDVPRTKPDPDHLWRALTALGEDAECGMRDAEGGCPTPYTLHPTPCLMVGDHHMDIQAGRAAGMRTVGLLWGRGPEAFAPAPPDLLVDRLEQLLPLLDAA
jgi:phosphoglycolate phosphatase